ncbi:hypothetical protein R50072_15730 [Simiduia litorea]|uniref:class I SAM-dependent methyltransferase n=1 Tax=Simiduia litorea TaxID=1435348 RepID=UPI0036F26C49
MKPHKLSSTDRLLSNTLAQACEQTLWLADENVLALLESTQGELPDLMTNRYDIHMRAKERAKRAWFADWDLTPCFSTQTYRHIIFRISKEKLVNHHILNQLADKLEPGATISLIGQKNEGIKSIADHAASCFGNKKINKSGSDYTVTIDVNDKPEAKLDSQDYPSLRPAVTWQDDVLLSKPGTFGWQKIDDGSAFLLSQLGGLLEHLPKPKRLLDLGCGYGYLSAGAKLTTKQAWPNTQWLATDNCAAALIACHTNCGSWADVFAGDRGLDEHGNTLRAPVDLILCNPPFHQGFSPTGDITEKFLKAMQRWLTPKGQALIVVNQFVGIEKRAQGLFKSCQTIADNGSFKVLLLTRH